MANDLEQKIITQVEYYFGDINLPRDKFLKETIGKNEGGWVPLDVLLTFKRLADLSKDKKVIVDAIEKSDAKLVEISDDKEKLRRSVEKPLPELTDEERASVLQPRTAYAKGFPKDEVFDNIMEFVKTQAEVDSLSMRHYKDKATNESKFKGSVNIIFKTEEDCKKFLESEDKYKDVTLQKLSQEAFVAEKKAEYEARKLKKNKGNKNNVQEKKFEYPKKSIVKLSGNTVGGKLKWDEIKARVTEVSEMEVAHVNFKVDETDGHMRFAKENEADEFIKKLTDAKFTVGDAEFTATLLTDEEESGYYKNWNDRQSQKHRKGGKHFGRKRKGNFAKDTPESKKQQQG